MAKHKIAPEQSQKNNKRRHVSTPGPDVEHEQRFSRAIEQAVSKLQGTPIDDPQALWGKVTEEVLDILALPDGQREETREVLSILIETDPRLQETIERGIRGEKA